MEQLRYTVSADFGQTSDYTAVAVTRRVLVPVGEVEADRRYNEERGHHYFVWHRPVEQRYELVRLDRVPLRTSYTAISKGLVQLVKQLDARHREEEGLTQEARVSVGLAIDEGGVGRAVRDILWQELLEGIPKGYPRIHFLPVTVHGGATTTAGDGWYHCPKRDLIGAGIVAFQDRRLKVGRLRHRETLENELANYRLKQNIATGHTAFEPLREGQHDDLLFATCLGVWVWERGLPKKRYVRHEEAVLG